MMYDFMPYHCLPNKVGIFYDWCSLFQAVKDDDGRVVVQRTKEQHDAFQFALREMQLWYAHQKLFALLLTTMPQGSTAPPYEARGWPTTERAWTMVAKMNANAGWPMICDVGTGDEAARSAPMHPEQVAELLASKKFTSPKADQ